MHGFVCEDNVNDDLQSISKPFKTSITINENITNKIESAVHIYVSMTRNHLIRAFESEKGDKIKHITNTSNNPPCSWDKRQYCD